MPSSAPFAAVPRAITTNALNALHYWPKRRPLQLLPYLVSTFFFFYFAYQVAVFPFPKHLPRGAHSSGSAWLHDDHSRIERYSHKAAVSVVDFDDLDVGITGRMEGEQAENEGDGEEQQQEEGEEWKPDEDPVTWNEDDVQRQDDADPQWNPEGEPAVHDENNEEWKPEGEAVVHDESNEEWKPEGEAVVHEENNDEWKPEVEAVVHEENNDEWKPDAEPVVHEENNDEWKPDAEPVVHEETNHELNNETNDENTQSTTMEMPALETVRDESGNEQCLELIVYDKPVKTGSTAVRDALLEYLTERESSWVECTFDECLNNAEKMLTGEVEKKNLVEHMQGANGIITRLGSQGFYKVTSVRDPRSRWESAYRYNKMLGARHYGIEPDVTYEEFMRRMPECSLYDFYDKLGGGCDMGGGWEKRLKEIVERYHEVIDLYDDSGEYEGQLFKRLKKWVRISNKSPEYESNGDVDESRWDKEMRLYEALRERRKQLVGKEPRLC